MTTLLSILLSIVPLNEARMIARVAGEYALTEEQTLLLAAIRKVENGGPGVEFGVGQDYPNHPARRYKNSPARSFLVQAKWAAGTIDKHYTGDLAAFARHYCPKNSEEWQRNVKYWMNTQRSKK